MLTRLHQACALALVIVLLPVAAMAETVDVTPGAVYVLDIVEALVGLAITVVLGFAAMWVRPFVGDRIATSAAEKLERAARRAVTAARMKYMERSWTLELENKIVAEVAEYLGQQLPEAMATVGLTPEGARRFAERMLGEEIGMLPPEERPAGYVGQAGLT